MRRDFKAPRSRSPTTTNTPKASKNSKLNPCLPTGKPTCSSSTPTSTTRCTARIKRPPNRETRQSSSAKGQFAPPATSSWKRQLWPCLATRATCSSRSDRRLTLTLTIFDSVKVVKLHNKPIINKQEHASIQQVEHKSGVPSTQEQLVCTLFPIHGQHSGEQSSVFPFKCWCLAHLGRHFGKTDV